MGKLASFANLTALGAGMGALKGAIEQPDEQVLTQPGGIISSRSYNPLERLTNVAINTAGGAALGYGGNTLLNNPRQAGLLLGKARDKTKSVWNKVSEHLPEIEVEYTRSS